MTEKFDEVNKKMVLLGRCNNCPMNPGCPEYKLTLLGTYTKATQKNIVRAIARYCPLKELCETEIANQLSNIVHVDDRYDSYFGEY